MRRFRQQRDGQTDPAPDRGRRRARCALLAAGLVALVSAGASPAEAEGPALSLRRVIPDIAIRLPPPPAEEEAAQAQRYFPFLEGEETDRSLSVGDTSHGFLVGGRAVTESEALAILPEQRRRNLRYGTEELVETLELAAAQYHAATGRRMWIGNIGREGGGDIPWSVSHNSGRDADIAFAYLDHRREPVDPPDLVPLNGHGVSREQGLFFDAEGTWRIVKGLISHPSTQVQYLFIEAGLRDQVLVAAQRAGEPVGLIQRAATVMRQPAGSAPHSDHLHLRVYCSRRDVIGGCQNTGVVHPWAELHEGAKERATRSIAALSGEGEPDERKRAIERLVLLGASETLDAITERLSDREAPVRHAAARAIGALGDSRHVPSLVRRIDDEPDLPTRVALIQSVGRLGGEAAGHFLADALGEPRRDPARALPAIDAAAKLHSPALLALLPDAASLSREALVGAFASEASTALPFSRWLAGDEGRHDRAVTQLAAIAASAQSRRLEPVPALIGLLADRNAEVRSCAAHSLRMITNVTYRTDWAEGDEATREAGLARWRAAWRRTHRAPRAAWMVMGFRAEGYDVPDVRQKHLWELVRATTGADHLSYNAQILLTRLTDHDPPSASWSKNDACQHWLQWLKRRRRAFDLDAPPRQTVAACFAPAD